MIELKKQKRNDGSFYEFTFEATSNPQHAIPYVARLSPNGTHFERHFFELDRVYAQNSVTVSGVYAAQEGEIIELCKGGNTTRKYRSIYLVYMGRLEFLGKSDDALAKSHILAYLNNHTDVQELRNAFL